MATHAVIGTIAFLVACAPSTPTSRGAIAPVPAGLSSWESGDCFSTAALTSEDQQVADRVLLAASDGEALYTLAGGLKPLSSGRAVQVRIAPTLDTTALEELEQLRRVSAALTCGDIGAFVHVFTAVVPAADSTRRRSAEIVVFHKRSVAAAVRRQADFFATLGITESADVREVLAAVENAPRAERWRGYGLLFGYPDEAVDFFVRAGVEGASTRSVVPRDFRRIDTYTRFPAERGAPPTLSSFVYAVPKGAPESLGDRVLREAAAPIYARYLVERARLVRADSSGAVELWRQWLGGAVR